MEPRTLSRSCLLWGGWAFFTALWIAWIFPFGFLALGFGLESHDDADLIGAIATFVSAPVILAVAAIAIARGRLPGVGAMSLLVIALLLPATPAVVTALR